MISPGKKMAIPCKEIGLSQSGLAEKLKTYMSVISRYKSDELIPGIQAAKKFTDLLGSTVGYLPGEKEESNYFKDLRC